jgi:hypothetical protein
MTPHQTHTGADSFTLSGGMTQWPLSLTPLAGVLRRATGGHGQSLSAETSRLRAATRHFFHQIGAAPDALPAAQVPGRCSRAATLPRCLDVSSEQTPPAGTVRNEPRDGRGLFSNPQTEGYPDAA